MCESINPYVGHLTYRDVQAAQKYAIMKIMYEQAQKYKNLQWVNSNEDGSPNYYCPIKSDGTKLDCKDGYVRIANKQECQAMSNFDQYMEEDDLLKIKPGANSKYYLEWREPENQCYMGNPFYRKKCITGNFDPTIKGNEILNSTLNYDESKATCYITKDYCDRIGKSNYIPGPGPNGDGGTCELTGGQKALDFVLGSTFAQGILGGACFK